MDTHTDQSLEAIKKEWHGSYKSYAIGFIGSLILTSISFLLVLIKPFSTKIIIASIVALALIQATLQLLLFLHLGKEAKPRWETWIFLFMLSLLLIIVIGSLWVMFDLNARMMPDMNGEMTHE